MAVNHKIRAKSSKESTSKRLWGWAKDHLSVRLHIALSIKYINIDVGICGIDVEFTQSRRLKMLSKHYFLTERIFRVGIFGIELAVLIGDWAKGGINYRIALYAYRGNEPTYFFDKRRDEDRYI